MLIFDWQNNYLVKMLHYWPLQLQLKQITKKKTKILSGFSKIFLKTSIFFAKHIYQCEMA